MPKWCNGSHVSLRSWCLKGRVGSSPTFGTTKWPISIVWLNAPHCRCGDRRFKSGIGRNRGSSHGWSQLSWMLVQSQRGIMKGSFLPSSIFALVVYWLRRWSYTSVKVVQFHPRVQQRAVMFQGWRKTFAMFLGGFDSHTVHKHINLSTCTAVSNGLSYIQFLGAGSRMLRSVFYSQVAKLANAVYGSQPLGLLVPIYKQVIQVQILFWLQYNLYLVIPVKWQVSREIKG